MKTRIKAIKPCFTLIIIALITAVVLFVPAAAFAEGDADGDGFADGGDAAETTSEPAVDVASNPETSVSNTTPTETPVSDNNSTDQSTEVNGTSSGNDTDSNTGDHDPEPAESEAFTDADDLDQSNSDASNNEPTSQETTPLPETSPAENTPDSESDETNSANPDQDDLSGDGQKGNSYIAEIAPGGVVGVGKEPYFEVTFSEVGTSTLGSAQLNLPANFEKGENESITIESSLDSDVAKWEANWIPDLGYLAIVLSAIDDSGILGTNEWVKLGFNAITPNSVTGDSETFHFTTSAWTDRVGETVDAGDGSTNQNRPAEGVYNNVNIDYSSQTLSVTVSETIQNAIDSNAIAPGDSIHIHSGTYGENVLIDKADLTLRALPEDSVDIAGNVYLAAPGITLQGFPSETISGDVVVVFADHKLEEAIREELSKTEGYITLDDVLSLTTLRADIGFIYPNPEYEPITSIAGLDYATNIETLYMWGNQISDIGPLAWLTSLQIIHLGYNQISVLSPLAGLTSLQELHLGGNLISDISALESLSNLQRLHLDYNLLDDISSLSSLTNLQWLGLSANNISDLTTLDVLSELHTLSIGSNSIVDLSPLVGLANLQILRAWDNQIVNIAPLAGITTLVELQLNSNEIADISTLTALTNLQKLGLGENFINDVTALAELHSLTDLYAPYNQISNIEPLSGLSNLLSLNLGHNLISDISPLSGLSNLNQLYLVNNQIVEVTNLSGLGNLEWLGLELNQINKISGLADLSNIENIDLYSNKVNDISPLSGLVSLRQLRLESNLITDVAALANLTDLVWLSLSSNQISDATALAGLTGLVSLDLGYNKVSDIGFIAGMANLDQLLLHNNLIEDISPLVDFDDLRLLYLTSNNIDLTTGSPSMDIIQSLLDAGVMVYYEPQNSTELEPDPERPVVPPFLPIDLPLPPTLGPPPGLVLVTQTMPALQSLITTGFIANGTKGNLNAAILAYNRALQLYQTYGASLSPAGKASAETTLAAAWAAIQALEVSLQARAGEQVDLGLLIEAYNQARAVLAENRDLLSPAQIAYTNAILAEIGTLISALTPQTT